MSPTREAVHDALRALDAVVDAAHVARRYVEELLASSIDVGASDAGDTTPLAPVISIVEAKSDDAEPEAPVYDERLLAAARANPGMFPHVPEHLRRR